MRIKIPRPPKKFNVPTKTTIKRQEQPPQKLGKQMKWKPKVKIIPPFQLGTPKPRGYDWFEHRPQDNKWIQWLLTQKGTF